MAASVTDMATEDSSSSSDDEALRRCQEAVWDCQASKTEDTGDIRKPSKRLVVADHEHDGNELQVTQGFQTHVGRKLGAMLDNLISEELHPSSVNTETTDNKNDEDEGFRLFSSSVPGQKPEEPPPTKRRRIPSSSDSDSEMESRIREAAVSISDILPPSTVPTINSAAPEMSSSETKEKVKKKKKKKRKVDTEVNGQQDSEATQDNKSTKLSQEENQVVKHKKKKKRKVDPEENGQQHSKPTKDNQSIKNLQEENRTIKHKKKKTTLS